MPAFDLQKEELNSLLKKIVQSTLNEEQSHINKLH